MTIDKTISTLARKYNRQAARQAIKTTLHHLANIEANLRFDARIALEVGLPAKTQRVLQEAANVREAINLIETHAVYQD
jgi:citrate lyase gamma subunit